MNHPKGDILRVRALIDGKGPKFCPGGLENVVWTTFGNRRRADAFTIVMIVGGMRILCDFKAFLNFSDRAGTGMMKDCALVIMASM